MDVFWGALGVVIAAVVRLGGFYLARRLYIEEYV